MDWGLGLHKFCGHALYEKSWKGQQNEAWFNKGGMLKTPFLKGVGGFLLPKS
ncbi:hypothetical protein SAMD00079811_24590 [Scytonema sp. HK-05]|nr:hypothetical protein SAMD00079811_24590 [Scytonema sp. HK-05]